LARRSYADLSLLMRTNRARLALLVLVSLAGSQAGHLLIYQARFGAAAVAIQTQGAHSYLPLLVTTLIGVLGAAGLIALLAIASARLVVGRRLGFRAEDRWPIMDVLPLLFVLQLATYFGQESLESAVAGAQAQTPLDLLLWGPLGQLPIAMLGALALSWISIRLYAAARVLRIARAEVRPPRFERPVALDAARTVARAVILAQCSPVSFAKRGPPHPS